MELKGEHRAGIAGHSELLVVLVQVAMEVYRFHYLDIAKSEKLDKVHREAIAAQPLGQFGLQEFRVNLV